MDKVVFPQDVSQLANWYENGTLSFGLPARRGFGKWNLLQKSLFVHSILEGFPVPAICLAKYIGKGSKTAYQVVDGRQRCKAVFGFIRGEYALHSSIPAVTVKGARYGLANRMFEELPEECRGLVTGFCFMVYVLENAGEEEVEEVFARLNAGALPTFARRARKEMGAELAGWAREVAQLPFFQHAVPLTLSQARRESELEILLKSMSLMDAPGRGYGAEALSMPEVMEYCRYIRGNYSEGRQKEIQCVAEYLSDAFTQRHKFLKKDNVPMVFAMAELALKNDIEPSAFKAFIDSFASSVCLAFEEDSGAGSGKREKAERRLLALYHEFVKYFKIEGE